VYQRVFAVQTVGAPVQASLAADMKLPALDQLLKSIRRHRSHPRGHISAYDLMIGIGNLCVQAAAETNTVTAEHFLKVAGFSKPPVSLMHPAVMMRVATTNRRQKHHSDATGTPGDVTADLSVS
jgi:hypothetical protein